MQNCYPPVVTHRHCALFLDVDGTLVDFLDDPDDVWLSEALLQTMASLHEQLHSALALVSGRAVADLERMITGRPFSCIGLHGLAHNSHSPISLDAPHIPDELAELQRACRAFVELNPGVMLEDKQFGIALHYRRHPQYGAAVHTFARDYLQEKAGDSSFALLEGKMLVEFRPRNADKGSAIEQLIQQPPFKGRLPIFIGDDVTDETGFAAVNSARGVSIKCGEGDTCAQYRLPDVQAVHTWLAHYLTYLTEA